MYLKLTHKEQPIFKEKFPDFFNELKTLEQEENVSYNIFQFVFGKIKDKNEVIYDCIRKFKENNKNLDYDTIRKITLVDIRLEFVNYHEFEWFGIYKNYDYYFSNDEKYLLNFLKEINYKEYNFRMFKDVDDTYGIDLGDMDIMEIIQKLKKNITEMEFRT